MIATSVAGSTDGQSQTFEAPSGVFEPLSTTTSPQPAGSGGSSSSPTPDVQSPGTGLGKTIKLKSLTNAHKLAKALKACEKKPKGKPACEKQAHGKYGTAASKAKKG